MAALGVGVALAGCTNYVDEGEAVDDDALVSVALKGENVVVKIADEKVQKTLSYSKDFGTGSNTFAATAIITTSATFNMNGTLNLKPTWNSARTRLDKMQASMTGNWDIQGAVDVNFKLTGNAAANKQYITSVTKNVTDMIKESRALKSFSLKALKLPLVEVTPTVELVLDCTATAAAEFNATASAGIKGSVGYELNWNRAIKQGEVDACSKDGKPAKVQHNWSFTNKTPKPTVVPPTFSVVKADGSINFRCAMKPRLALDMSLGVQDVLEAALSASVDGGIYVGADASADALAKKWTATAVAGQQMNAYAKLKLVVFCKEIEVDGSSFTKALIGKNEQGEELYRKSYSGGFL